MTLNSIWFVARIIRKLGLTLQDCESETLFPILERIAGSYIKEFQMLAHEVLYVVQVADNLNGNRVVTSTNGFSNEANVIDNNFATLATANSLDTDDIVIDFGADATRSITIIAQSIKTGGSSSGTISWNWSVSDDDITYGSETTITELTKSGTTGDSGILSIDLGSITSFRYMKIKCVKGGAQAWTGKLYQLYAPADSSGYATIQFEIKDDERVQWIETIPVAVANTIVKPTVADIQTEQLTRITTLSNCAAGKLRAKLIVIDGKSKDSVFVIKHGKQA